jgi:hypothetical protein
MVFLVLSILLGFIVGNSGIAESSSIFLALLALVTNLYRRRSAQSHFRFRVAISAHLAGVGLGLATIFIAPGFSNRNNRLGKIDEDFFSLLESFRSSLASFFGEILTHPIWLLAFLIVISWKSSLKIDSSHAKSLLLFFSLTFVMLVLGGTFGYAAWHQSSGLIFLLAPVAYCIPLLNSPLLNILKKSGLAYKKIAFFALTLSLLGMLARGVIVQKERSYAWDSNLARNYCSAIQSSELPLLGAEIKYWPIGLGVEDVNRWEWMEEDYRSWLSSIYQNNSQKCYGLD